MARCGTSACEELFHAIYGSPLLQALVGLKASDASPRRHPGTDAEHVAAVAHQIADFKARIAEGGPREAAIRALLYIRLAEGAADERGLALLRRIRDEHGGGLTLGEFKQLVREQFFMLLLDEERALGAIPSMLASDRDGAARAPAIAADDRGRRAEDESGQGAARRDRSDLCGGRQCPELGCRAAG